MTKMKNSELILTGENLILLERPSVKRGDVSVPFKFNGKIRYAIVKNLKIINDALTSFNDLRKVIQQEWLDKQTSEATDDSVKTDKLHGEFLMGANEEVDELLALENEVELHLIRFDDLDLEQNAIDPRVVMYLTDKIIVDEIPVEKPDEAKAA